MDEICRPLTEPQEGRRRRLGSGVDIPGSSTCRWPRWCWSHRPIPGDPTLQGASAGLTWATTTTRPPRWRSQVPNLERVAAAPDDVIPPGGSPHPRLAYPPAHRPVHDVGWTGDGLSLLAVSSTSRGAICWRILRCRSTFRESAEPSRHGGRACITRNTSRGHPPPRPQPANILIDLGGQPCVADFAWAKQGRGITAGRDGRHSVYMSFPGERGAGALVDGRSDILSSRRPHGWPRLACSIGGDLHAEISGRRPPPSLRPRLGPGRRDDFPRSGKDLLRGDGRRASAGTPPPRHGRDLRHSPRRRPSRRRPPPSTTSTGLVAVMARR